MKTVRVRAANLKKGDIYDGQRIKEVMGYPRKVRTNKPSHHKLEAVGVLIITPNRNGYDLNTFKFRGDTFVKVKRPQYNMNK